MKHKWYDMIVAKAANMDLVTFYKEGDGCDWRARLSQDSTHFNDDFDFFLCLPQHKEACLHWLNDGDVQQSPLDVEQWVTSGNNRSWMVRHSFMQDKLKFRIKPRKEKRWIGVNSSGYATPMTFASKTECDSYILLSYKPSQTIDWQVIEIEIEV